MSRPECAGCLGRGGAILLVSPVNGFFVASNNGLWIKIVVYMGNVAG